ncbi:hypothetical protein H5410_027552 [Solanum commersonii]|uniref:Uncharacterized protein n=1 Tax=Solanum commersonii TaxID=4109 RepID=A0A9J5Z3P3_SOLCO|nr:hypothetical protein H5410_027552 [Solanum commersonii]
MVQALALPSFWFTTRTMRIIKIRDVLTTPVHIIQINYGLRRYAATLVAEISCLANSAAALAAEAGSLNLATFDSQSSEALGSFFGLACSFETNDESRGRSIHEESFRSNGNLSEEESEDEELENKSLLAIEQIDEYDFLALVGISESEEEERNICKSQETIQALMVGSYFEEDEEEDIHGKLRPENTKGIKLTYSLYPQKEVVVKLNELGKFSFKCTNKTILRFLNSAGFFKVKRLKIFKYTTTLVGIRQRKSVSLNLNGRHKSIRSIELIDEEFLNYCDVLII